MTKYITGPQAARLLGITPRRVRALCAAGRILGARRAGRDWRIPLTEGRISIVPGTRGPKSSVKP